MCLRNKTELVQDSYATRLGGYPCVLACRLLRAVNRRLLIRVNVLGAVVGPWGVLLERRRRGIFGLGMRDCLVVMADRPEELELVDRYVGAAELAHMYTFDRYRHLVELGVDPELARRLLAQSAAIALQEIPALLRDWHVLEREWFEVELLDPGKLDRTTQALKARFAELDPALRALRARQDEIVAELVDLLNRARRP